MAVVQPAAADASIAVPAWDRVVQMHHKEHLDRVDNYLDEVAPKLKFASACLHELRDYVASDYGARGERLRCYSRPWWNTAVRKMLDHGSDITRPAGPGERHIDEGLEIGSSEYMAYYQQAIRNWLYCAMLLFPNNELTLFQLHYEKQLAEFGGDEEPVNWEGQMTRVLELGLMGRTFGKERVPIVAASPAHAPPQGSGDSDADE